MKSVEELVKARQWGLDNASHPSRAAVLAADGDAFAGSNTLDMATKRKLGLYQRLVCLLGEYLARLFFRMSRVELAEKAKRTVEQVTLTVFGYGQRREEYLMLKSFQHGISEEVRSAPTIADLVESHPLFLSIALQYVRPKQVSWLREILRTLVEEVFGQPAFKLETDPVVIYRAVISAEGMRSGSSSGKPIVATFEEAAFDPHTRAEYIRHLQTLRHLTEQLVNVVFGSVRKMPHGITSIVGDSVAGIKVEFPNQADAVYAAGVGRLLYLRFLHPAIVAADTFDMVPNTIGAEAGESLPEVAKIMTPIASSYSDGDGVSAPLKTAVLPPTTITESDEEDGDDHALDTADLQDSNPVQLHSAHGSALLEGTKQESSLDDSEEDSPAIVTLNTSRLEDEEDESDAPLPHYIVDERSPKEHRIEPVATEQAHAAVNPPNEVDIAHGSGEQHSPDPVCFRSIIITISLNEYPGHRT
ncbi:Rho GTPase activation protein [Calocera viscosa TUFC12733]|uniref:Rho GTPase activation protein n=1 Tax=Calocera viscosa (strain TUFC12733) TaxID=1330018 RepID=A0A167H8R1_CALVF|nr:Rho GTPase activation protein [Calocera viscosa TUFC12733]